LRGDTGLRGDIGDTGLRGHTGLQGNTGTSRASVSVTEFETVTSQEYLGFSQLVTSDDATYQCICYYDSVGFFNSNDRGKTWTPGNIIDVNNDSIYYTSSFFALSMSLSGQYQIGIANGELVYSINYGSQWIISEIGSCLTCAISGDGTSWYYIVGNGTTGYNKFYRIDVVLTNLLIKTNTTYVDRSEFTPTGYVFVNKTIAEVEYLNPDMFVTNPQSLSITEIVIPNEIDVQYNLQIYGIHASYDVYYIAICGGDGGAGYIYVINNPDTNNSTDTDILTNQINDYPKFTSAVLQNGNYLLRINERYFTNSTSEINLPPVFTKISMSATGQYMLASAGILGNFNQNGYSTGAIYNSFDYGKTWTQTTEETGTYFESNFVNATMTSTGKYQVVPASTNMNANSPGLIYFSANYGVNWEIMQYPNTIERTSSYYDASNILITTPVSPYYTNTTLGIDWSSAFISPDGTILTQSYYSDITINGVNNVIEILKID
jgi:hypothetical protein